MQLFRRRDIIKTDEKPAGRVAGFLVRFIVVGKRFYLLAVRLPYFKMVTMRVRKAIKRDSHSYVVMINHPFRIERAASDAGYNPV